MIIVDADIGKRRNLPLLCIYAFFAGLAAVWLYIGGIASWGHLKVG